MAIQISEHKLSPEAKKALNNAKNKSQFLRDAIEYYVKRGKESTDFIKMKEEIKEIKSLLIQMTSNSKPIYTETAVTETFKDNIVSIKKENNNSEDKTVERKDIEQTNKKPADNKKTNNKSKDLTERQKETLENLIDSSLGI